jgi:hypothetical protein
MLFYTMIDLNSEDVLYKLILSHLKPSKYLTIRPANAIKHMLSTSSKNAETFLSLSTIYTLNSTNIVTAIKRPNNHLKGNETFDALEWYKTLYDNQSLISTLEYLENISFNFSDYLKDAKYGIYKCRKECKLNWTCFYESYYSNNLDDSMIGIDADDFLLNLFTKSDSDYDSSKFNQTIDEKSINSSFTMKSSSIKRGIIRATTDNFDEIESYLNQLETNGKYPKQNRQQKDFYILSFDNELSSNESSFLSRSSSEISLNNNNNNNEDLLSIKETLIKLIFSSQSSIDNYLNSSLGNFLSILDKIEIKSAKKNENIEKIFESFLNLYQETSKKVSNSNDSGPLKRTSSLESLKSIQIDTLDDAIVTDLGPFMKTLFDKLEKILINPIQINFLVTGIISRLAYFPQPIVRSILLDYKANLNKILSKIKSSIDVQALNYRNFTVLYMQAKICLVKRLIDKKEAHVVSSSVLNKSSTDNLKRKNSRSFSDILKDIFLVSPKLRNNANNTNSDLIPLRKITKQSPFEWEDLKTQQLAYGTVIYDEFLKELASICEEHCVQQF